MTVEKPKPKQLLRPITTGAGSAINQSQFPAIICNSLEAREKWRVHGAIGFGFDSHWLKNLHESFKPITKHSNRNHVITFDSHLKTSLLIVTVMIIISVKFQQDDWARAVYYFILVILKYFQVCVSNFSDSHARK